MKKRIIIFVVLCIAAISFTGCIGGGTEVPTPPDNNSGGTPGNGSGSGSDGVTGHITGTFDGEPFTRYTLEATLQDGQYHNTAHYKLDILEGVWELLVVSLQGQRSHDVTQMEDAIAVNFILDMENNFELITFDPSEPPEILYFPDGVTFDQEKVFTMTDGSLNITSAQMDGDVLKVKGEFSGTLARQRLNTETGELIDLETKLIEGAFDIHKATPFEL